MIINKDIIPNNKILTVIGYENIPNYYLTEVTFYASPVLEYIYIFMINVQ